MIYLIKKKVELNKNLYYKNYIFFMKNKIFLYKK